MTLAELVATFTNKPAEAFDLPYGRLTEGEIADITLVDLDKEIQIDKNNFYSKGINTPFNEWEVTGIPVLTIAEGKVVYKDGLND